MYANIYRELIPFVRGAQEFHSYVYGSELFFRQITNRYLSTFWKPLNEAPSRLQRMLLKLTKYDVLSQENSRTFQTALAENLSVKLNHLTTRRCNRRQSCWETCNRKQHPEKIQGQLKYWWDIKSGDGVCFEMMTFRERTSWCFYPRILEFQSRDGFRGWHVVEIRPNCSPMII